MKAIGFNQGLRGDLVMSTVAARSFKEMEGQGYSKLYLGMNKKFQDMAPLFYQHSYFDSIHIYDQYDIWPNSKDITYLANQGFDHIFHAMKDHTSNNWYEQYHQCEEVCRMHGLQPPKNLQCSLSKWFFPYLYKYDKYVAFAPIGAAYAGFPNNKSYSIERGNQIVKICNQLGYKVIQIGGPNEYQFENTERKDLTYFDSVKTILGCKAFVTVDTGLNWVMSAYDFPTLACYGHRYYGPAHVKNIQPIQSNGLYLDADEINNIDINLIEEKLKLILK